jgi:adenylate cyclase
VERAFQSDFGAEHHAGVRRNVLVIALVFAVFVLNDAYVFADRLAPLAVIRGVVVAGFVATWLYARTEAGGRRFAAHLQGFVLGLGLTGAAGMIAMSSVLVAVATPQRLWFATLGFVLALVAVYGYSRLRFALAVPLGLLTSAGALSLLARTAPGGPTLAVILPFGLALNVAGAWMTYTLELLARRAYAERQLLAEARARSEALLRNALPTVVADRLRGAGPRGAIADRYDEVTVVLADVVGFTPLCERLEPAALAELLDGLHRRFDGLCEQHGVEKIKTLGDAWLAAGGVPVPGADHAVVAARFALALRDASGDLPLRIGLHTGPAVAGVIGRTRFAYDLWGDAVTGAGAMERASRPGGIRVSPAAADRLGPRFVLREDEGGLWLLEERG